MRWGSLKLANQTGCSLMHSLFRHHPSTDSTSSTKGSLGTLCGAKMEPSHSPDSFGSFPGQQLNLPWQNDLYQAHSARTWSRLPLLQAIFILRLINGYPYIDSRDVHGQDNSQASGVLNQGTEETLPPPEFIVSQYISASSPRQVIAMTRVAPPAIKLGLSSQGCRPLTLPTVCGPESAFRDDRSFVFRRA